MAVTAAERAEAKAKAKLIEAWQNGEPKPENLCQQFLLCTNEATATRNNPILGDIRVCKDHTEENWPK